ncbi:MAG: glycine zipper 2TM domain-containing protein [Planctomycetota bacterium]
MKPAHFSTRSLVVRSVLAACLVGSAAALGGCNDAQAGALLGAGIGALAGQAIGHDTGSTVIGTAVGAGAGYVIGNESDKAKSRHDSRY